MNKNTISSNARSLIGIAVMAVLSLAVIAVSDPLYKALRGPVVSGMRPSSIRTPKRLWPTESIPMKLRNQTQTVFGTEPP